MKLRVILGTAALLAGALLLLSAADQPGGDASDRLFGLRVASVFDTPDPPVALENETAPGEVSVRPRPYPGAPPVIPHGIADFLPITRDDNMCLGCHAVEEKVEDGPTPIPASHYTDLRNSPGTRQEEVVGARYLCVSCHVPLTDAKPLVENGF